MTEQGSQIEYLSLVQDAMRQVVQTVLERTAHEGLPGEHHFYIGFVTSHPGVAMSPWLHASYPDEMTVVLQNQYRDLEVDDEGFSVTLSFGGRFDRLSVPWDAMVSFYDPAVQFVLRFEPQEAEDAADGFGEAGAQNLEGDGGPPAAPIALHEAARGREGREARKSPASGSDETAAPEAADAAEGAGDDTVDPDEAPSADVVSLEAFRRK